MKKLIGVCEILIILVFLAKIALIGGAMKTSSLTDGFMSINTAAAESTTDSTPGVSVKKVSNENLSKERKLLSALLEKNKGLDDREKYLKSEEKRLNLLKSDILLAIDKLQALETSLATQFENINDANDKKFKALAKIYESAPAEWVGAMLENLDSKTAATIIMKMKNKSAGTVMGHLSPGKSIEITREITKTSQKP